MPTNPTEWHRELVFIRDAQQDDGEFTTAAYLTALCREWDAHEPTCGPDHWTCGECNFALRTRYDLCPARQRMVDI